MSSLAAGRAGSPSDARSFADRLLGALPLVTVFTWLTLIYAWQAWAHSSPWLFKDELEYTQLARSIAETGRAAIRGEAVGFPTLYAFLTAPAWLIEQTSTAYEVAKYIGVVTMTLAVFPVYALARLLVSARPALLAAAAAGAIPAYAYSSMLITEPLAYPFAALCFFLIVKALATKARGWLAAAAAAALVAPLVRSQLVLIPAVLALAAGLMWWLGERAGRLRARWSAAEWLAVALAAPACALAASELIGEVWGQWEFATARPGRMLEYGAWGLGALTIGTGVFPLMATVVALARRPAREAERAFLSVVVAAGAGFCLYAAGKATYVGLNFFERVPERNVIYLAPLLFVGMALWLERRRTGLAALAVATGLAAVLVATTPYQLDSDSLYADAPGLSILSSAAFYFDWGDRGVQAGLLVLVSLSALVLALPLALRRAPRTLGVVLAAVPAIVIAWNMTGLLSATDASNTFARRLLALQPQPITWLDGATGGEPAVFLGQGIRDPNGIQLLEFWNRSLERVSSLDGTAPGPGPAPVAVPTVLGGELDAGPDVRFAVADAGIELAGRVVSAKGTWQLHRIDPPLRIRAAVQGVQFDEWMGSASSYTRYRTPGNRAGLALVSLSRLGWCGQDVAGRVTISVSPLAGGKPGRPVRSDVHACQPWRRYELPAPRPPFRVDVTVTPTFVPSRLDPREEDLRELGAQVRFGFRPSGPG